MHKKKNWLYRQIKSVRKMLWLVSDRFEIRKIPGDSKVPSLGVIAIMKNEGFNIKEWVDHYKWQGADTIFLIDNGSTDGGRDIIKDDIDSGYVHYFWRPERHRQVMHYREVYDLAQIDETVDWLCMADLDEFWYCPGGTLKDAIGQLQGEADLIYCRWQIFGSSGHVNHPASLRKQLLHRRFKLDKQMNTKWICRTSRIVSSKAIDLHKVRWIDSRRVYVEDELLKINHYVTQSLQYFTNIKMTRGDASSIHSESVRDIKYFDRYNESTSVLDLELSDMLSQNASQTEDGQRMAGL